MPSILSVMRCAVLRYVRSVTDVSTLVTDDVIDSMIEALYA